ncbi:MAG: hypothetical protein ABIJ65_04630 [Chloroflexota bacterium]
MEEGKEIKKRFLGTYFDPSVIFRISTLANVLAWIIMVVYSVDFLVTLIVMILQIVRGFWAYMGPTDIATNILFTLERPFRGMVYFVVLMGISEILKLFVDLEENTRKLARKS